MLRLLAKLNPFVRREREDSARLAERVAGGWLWSSLVRGIEVHAQVVELVWDSDDVYVSLAAGRGDGEHRHRASTWSSWARKHGVPRTMTRAVLDSAHDVVANAAGIRGGRWTDGDGLLGITWEELDRVEFAVERGRHQFQFRRQNPWDPGPVRDDALCWLYRVMKSAAQLGAHHIFFELSAADAHVTLEFGGPTEALPPLSATMTVRDQRDLHSRVFAVKRRLRWLLNGSAGQFWLSWPDLSTFVFEDVGGGAASQQPAHAYRTPPETSVAINDQQPREDVMALRLRIDEPGATVSG